MYTEGNVARFWPDDFKSLNFVKQPVTEEESNKWQSLGYYHNNFTGNMYDSRNPMPEWVEQIGSHFDLVDKTYTIYRMDTLEIMPTHVDHFNRYSELFCKDKSKIRRVLVFLEDWKPGHYFEVAGKGIVNWKAGDFCMWEPHVDHAASNIGVESRYTLQITGHV